MTDTKRIKDNISSMIDQGAPESDIDDYITSETGPDGHAYRTFLSSLPAAAEPSQPTAAENNAVLQGMFDRGAPDTEIEQFLKSNGYQVPQDVKTYAAWRRENPDYDGDFSPVDIPLAYDGPLEFQNTKGGLEGTVSSVLEGIVPGLSRNAAGLGAGIANTLGTRFDGQDLSFSEAYDLGAGFSDSSQEDFETENPLLSGAARSAGFVGSLALPVTKIGQAGSAGVHSMGNAALNASATGGLYGTAAGALNDSGAGRLENAAWGGLAGTVLGGVTPPALGATAALGNTFRRNVPGVDGVASSVGNSFNRLAGLPPAPPAAQQQANRLVGESIAASPAFNAPAAVADEIQRRASHGVPAMPADLSEQTRRLTSTALSGNGPMTSRARQAIANRQAQQAARVRQHVQSDLGAAVDPIQAASDIRERAAAAAAPAYKQAYAEGIIVTPEIQQAMRTPAFQQGLKQAHLNILNRGGNPRELGMLQDAQGNVSLGEAPTMEAFDHVIRTIKQDLPRNPLTGRLELDSASAAAAAAADGLDGMLRSQNRTFDRAKSAYADEMAIQRALEQGQKVGKWSGHEINAQTRAMPQHAQEAWLSGASASLSDRAIEKGLRPTVNVAADTQRQLGFSGAGLAASHGDIVKLDALEKLAGQPGAIGRLGERLDLEDDAYKTFAAANRSRSGKPDFGQGAGGTDLLNAGLGLAAGDVSGALVSAILRGNPKGTGKFKQEVQEQIADTLSQADPQAVQQAMRAIERQAATDAAKRARMGTAATHGSRVGAIQLGGANGDPYSPR